jgi:GNAT superfamily N-acetyltransferase
MRVALVTESQHESLVGLLCEVHSYYNPGSSVSHDLVHSYLINHLLGGNSPLRLVVASQEREHVVGFAAISLTYSLVEPTPDKRRQCWLKELYVRSSARGLGAGTALMSWVARYAAEHGCSRIDWPVKASNTRGIAFYERLEAKQVADSLSYRLSEPELRNLASKCGGTGAG